MNRLWTFVANDSDRDWEKWGNSDPYYGVHRDDKFLGQSLTQEAEEEFFRGGSEHVSHVYELIRAHLRADFHPANVLDYGCGVGRLVVPFCRVAENVTGVDVSRSMLLKAEVHCRSNNVVANLIHTDQIDSLPKKSFDFIHSFIVMQHIPPAAGKRILLNLLELLAPGGIGALQFTYARDSRGFADKLYHSFCVARGKVNFVNGISNLLKGYPYSRPYMQMNLYSLSEIFAILTANDCHFTFVEHTKHGLYQGAMLYFVKSPQI